MLFIGAIGLFSILAAPSQALAAEMVPSAIAPMTLGAPVSPPVGYLRFCLRHPDQCSATNSAPAEEKAAISTALRVRPASSTSELRPASFVAFERGSRGEVLSGAALASSRSEAQASEIKTSPSTNTLQPTTAGTPPEVMEVSGSSGEGPSGAAPRAISARFAIEEEACARAAEASLQQIALAAGTSPDAFLRRSDYGQVLAKASFGRDVFQTRVPLRLMGGVCKTDAPLPRARPELGPKPIQLTFAVKSVSRPAAPSSGSAPVPVDAEVWSTLVAVNAHVNDAIRPMSDEQAFGISNYWTLPLSDGPRPVGNCKHYALEKRKALAEAGIPASALSLAIVRTRQGGLHAVLLVSTDHGELILDNLNPKIVGWNDARYTWLARQIPGLPLKWVAVNPRT